MTKNVFKSYIQISSNILILQKLIMLNKYLRQYVNLVIVNNRSKIIEMTHIIIIFKAAV